jgi:hypothetical protein
MMVAPRLLLRHDSPEVVTLAAVVLGVFERISKLLFQAGDARRRLTLLFFAPLTEACRCSRIASALLVGQLGGRLHVNGDLHVMALLALDGHELYRVLRRLLYGDHGTLGLHRSH